MNHSLGFGTVGGIEKFCRPPFALAAVGCRPKAECPVQYFFGGDMMPLM